MTGASAATIASALNRRGEPAHKGKRWHSTSVLAVLREPLPASA